MTQRMKQYLVKVAWAAVHYLKCQDGGRLHAMSCENKFNDTYRYCPQGQNTTCQPEGYTMFKEHNYEIPLLGADKLIELGIDADEILEASYNHYAEHGMTDSKPFESSEANMLTVCDSPYATINDFEHQKDWKQNGFFPCRCGKNWWGGETQVFMNKFKVGKGSERYNNSMAWDILVNTCNLVSPNHIFPML